MLRNYYGSVLFNLYNIARFNGFKKVLTKHIYGDDVEYELVEETVIDGVPVQVYVFPYVRYDNGEDVVRYEAYLYQYDMHYEITVYGDAVSIDDVLETVDLD